MYAKPTPPPRATSVALLLLAGALNACADRALDRPAFEVADSAGVRIVVNHLPFASPGEGWSLSARPELEVGVVHGDPRYEFGDVLGAVILSDGRLAVLDGISASLRFYDARGVFAGSAGRSGKGPGELNRPTGLLRLPGDTLLVSAYGNREASWFGPMGEFVRRDRLDAGRLGPTLGKVWGCPRTPPLLPDGTYLACVGTGPERHQDPGFPRASHLLVRVPFDLSWADTLGPIYGFNPELGLSAGPGTVAGGGNPLRIFVGDPAFFEIDVYADRGGRTASIRYPEALRPIGTAERAAFEAFHDSLRSATPEVYRHPSGEVLTRSPMQETLATTMPGFTGLHYDEAGFLWAIEFRPPWETTAGALIFSLDGELLSRVDLAPRFRITDIRGDRVLGVSRNELDVETIRLYRLSRGPGLPGRSEVVDGG